MSPDATWIVIGVLAVALIAGFLYLKHKDPTEAASISATASTDWTELKTWVSGELAKVEANFAKAPATAALPPATAAPPVVPTATPTGPVPSAEAIAHLETTTTAFHAAHANLTAAAKAVAAP